MRKTVSGFTIVELLIVIVVIAILAAISIVAYNGVQNGANDTAVQNDLRESLSGLMRFQVMNDRYPNSWAEINSTLTATRRAYGGGNNALIYCRSDIGAAMVGRSVSGNGYYQSTTSGNGKFASWPGDGNANLCPAAGIPTTAAGYSGVWIRVNGAWETWFTPGA